MNLDQKIQLWNAIGTWLAGLATVSASVLALWLAKRVEAVRLLARIGKRDIVGAGVPLEQNVVFEVTNLSERPVTINSIGWRVGKGKKLKVCIQPTASPYSQECPIELTYGKQARFIVSLSRNQKWREQFINGFVEDLPLKTLIAQVHTSLGKTVNVKPEATLVSWLGQPPEPQLGHR